MFSPYNIIYEFHMLATEKRFKIQAVRYFEYKTAKNFIYETIKHFKYEAAKKMQSLIYALHLFCISLHIYITLYIRVPSQYYQSANTSTLAAYASASPALSLPEVVVSEPWLTTILVPSFISSRVTIFLVR